MGLKPANVRSQANKIGSNPCFWRRRETGKWTVARHATEVMVMDTGTATRMKTATLTALSALAIASAHCSALARVDSESWAAKTSKSPFKPSQIPAINQKPTAPPKDGSREIAPSSTTNPLLNAKAVSKTKSVDSKPAPAYKQEQKKQYAHAEITAKSEQKSDSIQAPAPSIQARHELDFSLSNVTVFSASLP